MRRVSIVLLVAASLLLPSARAQESAGPALSESKGHINPVVAKLAAGKTVYGLITGDMSLANARETARAPVDFVYADMEHSPLDFPGLAIFLAGLTDKAAIVAKKSAQPNVALFARFPPEADQSHDTKEQALTAVRTMRYPPMRGSPRREPVGIRGVSTAAASYAWGVSAEEYERRADVWPLNPDGDLLAVIMIESVEGLEHLDQIASVPGVGALFLGAGSDLSRSMGVAANSPEVEAGFQQVLKACKAHKVACAITAGSTNDVVRRVKEGWSIIRSTVPAITQARTQLGDR